MTEQTNFNPEQAAYDIMTKSFLQGRDSLRQSGTGSRFFADNRIRSCSYIAQTKNGLKAVPFYDKRDNSIYPTKSQTRKGWTSTVHCNKTFEHAGMGTSKTLSVYDPSTQRNSLSIPDFKPPYPNSSHIQIGARSKRDVKHYQTTYKNDFIKKNRFETPTSHPGIIAFRNKWLRSRLAL